ncbi:MAG TPA: hypothetical protein VMM58_01725 [Bacteroidota bacterium]|nr:hypothetical protein [Bacteroidota bacterium]
MLESTRQRVGIALADFHFRKQTYAQTEFTRVYSDAHTALVIVPENSEHRALAIPLLTSLQNKFRGNKMTIVIYDSFRDLSSSLAHCEVFPMTKSNIGFFYLPKKKAVQRLSRQRFDVVFDLNIPMVLPAAYLCRSVNARLKVGFAKEDGDKFYNFQLKTSYPLSPQRSFEQLLRTMAMF